MSNLEHPNDIPVHWLLHRNLYNGLHPGRLTWNIQTTHFERNMIFATSRRLCSSRSSSRVYEIFSKCNWVGFHPHIWQQISKVLGTHVLHPMYCRKLQNPGFFLHPPINIWEHDYTCLGIYHLFDACSLHVSDTKEKNKHVLKLTFLRFRIIRGSLTCKCPWLVFWFWNYGTDRKWLCIGTDGKWLYIGE